MSAALALQRIELLSLAAPTCQQSAVSPFGSFGETDGNHVLHSCNLRLWVIDRSYEDASVNFLLQHEHCAIKQRVFHSVNAILYLPCEAFV